ncbi:MAG: endonuclease/exonuclease/phosphatase family protein [Actinomycetes bacterium]
MRVATWNVLHGMSISGDEPSGSLASQAALLAADIIGLQEIDRDQTRSNHAHQTRDVANAMGLPFWVFAPALVGTPGESWETANDAHTHLHSDPNDGVEAHYGVGLASRYPLSNIEVLRLKGAPISLPLLVPADPKPAFIKVADEPRVAIIADVETPDGIVTIATTHLSFVPGYNVKQLRIITKHLSNRKDPVLIIGDFNLPGKIGSFVTRWHWLARIATYPTPKPRIQFDHIIAKGISEAKISRARKSAQAIPLGVSDHCALVIEISI